MKNGTVKIEQRVAALEEALKEAVEVRGFEGPYRPSAVPQPPAKPAQQGEQAR